MGEKEKKDFMNFTLNDKKVRTNPKSSNLVSVNSKNNSKDDKERER